ncbi:MULTISPECIES: hypothetical protein [unclassified Streptomyces]|uniref:hypothetical protein n=1 Tax=unclassified Streptomyces TaxID=2593676 RepID=UPI002E2F9594|nr:hypothetical protein [Streptomyces sp. NBC_01268]
MSSALLLRRALGAAVLASALALTAAPAAFAAPPAPRADECAPDDQACKDQQANEEEAKEIEEEQKKTKESAAKADKDIAKVGKDLEKCKPGSEACMGELAKGNGEKKGLEDMTATVDGFKPDPKDNAQSAVTTTCADFPASLPAGSTDPGQSPFPVSQLCSLLGS